MNIKKNTKCALSQLKEDLDFIDREIALGELKAQYCEDVIKIMEEGVSDALIFDMHERELEQVEGYLEKLYEERPEVYETIKKLKKELKRM